MNDFQEHFSNPQSVANYLEGPPRAVPGYQGLLQMTRLLIAERVPNPARLLILGAGGGLEMRAFAEAHPDWTFDGVDPSAEMLDLAKETMGPYATRARLHHGLIDDAPGSAEGADASFDAGTCLLTLHFLPPEERQRTLAEVRRRLKPGAPFVAAHLSVPQGNSGDDDRTERELWLARYAAYVTASGTDPDSAEQARAAIDTHLHLLAPEEDEAILRAAGFSKVTPFYVGFAFRAWVGYA